MRKGGYSGNVSCLGFFSFLVMSTMPSHAEGPGDVLQGIGRAMNGEPPPPTIGVSISESGPIGTSSIVSMPSNATLMRAAGLCATGAASTRKTAFLAADPGVVG